MDVKPRKARLPALSSRLYVQPALSSDTPRGGAHFAPDGVIGDLKTNQVSCAPLTCQDRNGLPPNG